MFTICLSKEPFKFSCSHFTILAADKAERLHGHNYQVSVEISIDDVDSKLGFAFDFNQVKPLIAEFCDKLDERILLPLNSPYLQLFADSRQTEVRFNDKYYSFPTGDTLCLPLINVTAEELARYAGIQLAEAMTELNHWTELGVQVEETRGQSVSYRYRRRT